MKGAVSTIVLVIIAIVAIAAIGYNFYLQQSSTLPIRTTSTTDCQNKLVSYCTTWSANGYGRDAVSAGGRPGPWDRYASSCNDVTPSVDICGRALRTSAATGRATAVSKLGFLESCDPNRDMCDVGLICKLGRDSVYRCLRQS